MTLKKGLLSLLILLALALPQWGVAETQIETYGDNLTYTLGDDGTLTISIDKETRILTVTSYDDHFYEITVDGPEYLTIGLTPNVSSASRYLSLDGIYNVSAVDMTSLKSAGSLSFILGTAENYFSCVSLPADLKTIEEEAFAGAAFEAVIIPDGCTTIGSRAFADCPNLVYVRIPASVVSIAEDAFAGCGQVMIDRITP